jgi:ribosomal protein L10
MPSIVNKMALAQLSQAFGSAEGAVVVSLNGLTVAETEKLRTSLSKHGLRLRMVPSKLAIKAFKAAGHDFPRDAFKGNTAVAAGSSEAAIMAAKVFTTPEVKKAGKITLRAGLLDGQVLGPADAVQMANVPDKDTLRSKILGCISGPPQKLVGILAAPGASLARVLQAKVDAAGGADAGAGAAESA